MLHTKGREYQNGWKPSTLKTIKLHYHKDFQDTIPDGIAICGCER